MQVLTKNILNSSNLSEFLNETKQLTTINNHPPPKKNYSKVKGRSQSRKYLQGQRLKHGHLFMHIHAGTQTLESAC